MKGNFFPFVGLFVFFGVVDPLAGAYFSVGIVHIFRKFFFR